MNDIQKAKIVRFINDKEMSGAVRQALINSFVHSKIEKDVHLLAAARLAVDFLDRAWGDLERTAVVTESRAEEVSNHGL